MRDDWQIVRDHDSDGRLSYSFSLARSNDESFDRVISVLVEKFHSTTSELFSPYSLIVEVSVRGISFSLIDDDWMFILASDRRDADTLKKLVHELQDELQSGGRQGGSQEQ